jgi:electron transfer flavoprotein alpha subunit
MNRILLYLQASPKFKTDANGAGEREGGGFELHPIGKELIGEALRISNRTGAEIYGTLIIGSRAEENAETNAEKIFGEKFLSDIRGLKELRVYRDEIFDGFETLVYAKTLKACADEIMPDAVLVGGTPEGRCVAPAAAALLKTGATADCVELKWDGGELLQIRPAFGGSVIAEISTPFSRPAVATLGAGFFKKYQDEARGECEKRVIAGAENDKKLCGKNEKNIVEIPNGKYEKRVIAGAENDEKLCEENEKNAVEIPNEECGKRVIAGAENGEKRYEPNEKTVVVFCKPNDGILSSLPLKKRASVAIGDEFKEKEIVVAVGGGVKKTEDLKIFYEICEKIGASLMCSRVVSERGFLARSRQIGLSGKIISPKLLLTFGVSGAAEFLAGIGAAERIIAVNSDENAPIMKIADEASVGDMYEIAKEIVGRDFS